MARSAAEPWVPKCQQETGRENGSAVTSALSGFLGLRPSPGLHRQRFWLHQSPLHHRILHDNPMEGQRLTLVSIL